MRRLNDDQGAVAVIVGVIALVLFGMGAMVLDVGSLWSERRQLQNGADAGALAIAQACADGSCAGYQATAEQYADSNANDGASNVQEVCGSSPYGDLPTCTAPPSQTPVGDGWVMVRTQTGTDTGPSVVPPIFAKAIVPDYNGTTVSAYAIANWGAPAGVTGGLALTISKCDWLAATANGTDYASPPPYTSGWPVDSAGTSLEQVIDLHDPSYTVGCQAGPAGAFIPGGFGWLDHSSDCTATTTDGWFGSDTGTSVPTDCKDPLAAYVGQLIYVPVFDATTGSGNTGQYELEGYAAFYLTGYLFPGWKQKSLVTGDYPCTAPDNCISGFFTQALVPQGGVVGGSGGFGASVVGLAQ